MDQDGEGFGDDPYDGQDFPEAPQSFASLIDHCVIPSWLGAFEFLLPLIAASIILQSLLTVVRYPVGRHLSTISAGLAIVAWQLRDKPFLLLCVVIHSLAGSLLTSRATQKTFVWVYCLSVLISNEASAFKHLHHIRIRNHLMLLLMKFVSWNQSESEGPADAGFMSCLSYALHPMSIGLGSWHPVIPAGRQRPGRLIKSVVCLSKGILMLLASNCLIQFLVTGFFEPLISFNLYYFLPESGAVALHKLLISYFVALQFRSSHYFICFTTESSFSFWGSDLAVAKPGSIEVPRSLVEVVVCWNIPFHIWIRKHVFKPLQIRCGGRAAVLLTYCVSSLLHGFNFQIWSVLLTLGCLTLLEFRLRQKLSQVYSACMESKKCSSDCGHEHRNPLFANTFFCLLAMAHLSFLGSAFDGKEDSSYMHNVLAVWSSLGFYSPILGIFTLSAYLLI